MNSSADSTDGEASLENLYPALVQCFAVIISGYAAGRLNLISRQEAKGLNVFVSTFSLPCLIFLSLAELDLNCVNWMFLLSILLAKSIVFFGVIIVTVCISRPLHLGKPGIYAIFCTQSNDFAIGYPILLALYGKTHPEYPSYLYLMAPISLAILNPIAFILMEYGKQAQLKESATNPEMSESSLTRNDSTSEGIMRQESNNRMRSRFTVPETPTASETANEETDQNCLRAKSQLKVLGLVTKSIVSNPIVFMTVLGIIGNMFYRYLRFVTGILEVFGSAFSGTALFLLGLRMVGTMHKLKNDALVLPAILIAVKLLVLPLVTREVTSLISPGVNTSDTLDLSTYAFLYGTFPTAPAAFVFATQYNLEIDLISSGMVACTFISAPLMFISAKMTSLDTMHPENHYKELNNFGYELGIGGLVIGSWMIVLFIVTRKITQLPHKITTFLIISQIITCIGALLMHIKNLDNWYGQYLQFYVFEFGVYSTRVWTAQLAISLLLMHARGMCLVIKLLPYLVLIGWGVPVIVVTLTGVFGVSQYDPNSLNNPYFIYGTTQAIATLFILLICFIATGASLVMLQRHRRMQARYETLVRDVNSRDIDNENTGLPTSASTETRMVIDIEELASPDQNPPLASGCSGNSGDMCMSGMCSEQARQACSATLREYRNTVSAIAESENELGDPQTLRHVILLLLLLASMFVGIMLSIWTLVADDLYSGIYVEMAFLDVTLNVGQIFLTFAVFGLDAWSVLSPIVSWWRKLWYGDDRIVLPNIDDLSFETTLVCHQFIAHHLNQCEQDLAKNIRSRLVVYKSCFRGSELSDWLIAHKLTKDHEEAAVYASHLVLGYVLRHVDDNHYFSNSNLLYTFRP